MAVRYDARRDRLGWTVFDRWTGMTVVLAGAAQRGLAWTAADDLVARLNRTAPGAPGGILQ